MALCAPSTSGRLAAASSGTSASVLRWGAGQLSGRGLPLCRPSLARPQRRTLAPVTALLRRNHKAYNKYRSRQDLEVEYVKEWEQTTVLAESEAARPLSVWTLLAFVPSFLKFYVIPGPIRYVWYYMCCLAEEAAYQLRKRAVIAGAKLDLATLQRRGAAVAAGYSLRGTALRRLHGKESLLRPLALALGARA